MQLELFDVVNTFKDKTNEMYECVTCKEMLPASMFRIREDRSGYRSKSCNPCHSKNVRHVQKLAEVAPPKPDRCDCCGNIFGDAKVYLDHCHDTGEFRGWLCNSCNSGIGILGDTIEHLEQALVYLRKHYEKD